MSFSTSVPFYQNLLVVFLFVASSCLPVSGEVNAQAAPKVACLVSNDSILSSFEIKDNAELSILRQLRSFRIAGFIGAKQDSIFYSEKRDTLWVSTSLGQLYTFDTYTLESNQSDWPNPISERLSGISLKDKIENNLRVLENTGYPFAEVQFETREIDGNSLIGEISLKKGPLVRIDSLVIKSEDTFHQPTVAQLLSLNKGSLYNESQIRALDNALDEIPFLKRTRSTQVAFYETGAVVYLYLERKASSFFNGIVGFLPDNTSEQILITGELDIRLNNTFNRAETLSLNWRKLQNETQELKLAGKYPYLAGYPLGLEAHLDIYRRDSSFTDLGFGLGLLIQRNPAQFLRLFYESERNNQLRPSSTLNNLGDARLALYGVAINYAENYNPINPQRGWAAGLKLGTGQRENLSTDDQESAFASTYLLEFHIEKVQRLRGRLIALGNVAFWAKWSDTPLFLNEQKRIGGLGSLRGFDDQSLFADRFARSTVELRYLIGVNGFFQAFFEQAFISSRTSDFQTIDYPLSFGLGGQIETGAGIFALSYALGQQNNNPILLRNAKLHFGFISRF